VLPGVAVDRVLVMANNAVDADIRHRTS
jgi:hypothetical protein